MDVAVLVGIVVLAMVLAIALGFDPDIDIRWVPPLRSRHRLPVLEHPPHPLESGLEFLGR